MKDNLIPAKDISLSVFTLKERELNQAIKTYESFSTAIEDFDLSYGYDEDLNESPENSYDMNTYADVLIARVRIEMEEPSSERNWQEMAASLGMAGSLRRMTGRLNESEKLLNDSLLIIRTWGIGEIYDVQQSIRLFDLYKKMGRHEEALEGLSGLEDKCSTDKHLSYYLDVVIQHLGKVHFAIGNYETALETFERALELRKEKGDAQLLESTNAAIEACRIELGLDAQ